MWTKAFLLLITLSVIAGCPGSAPPSHRSATTPALASNERPAVAPQALTEEARAIPPNPRSGYFYQAVPEQTLQDDIFGNPGYLWVDEGKVLFNASLPEDSGSTPFASCAGCHKTGSGDNSPAYAWQSAATRYPAFDVRLRRVIPVEARINQCRTRYQNRPAFAWESRELLALTAFVAHQSKDQPIVIEVSKENAASINRGATYYHRRKGQLNLACRHCHEQNPGRMLRGDRLSEGLPTGYPAYKLEWQGLGSIQRRLRNCDVGVRAQPHPFGAQIYADLTLYLKYRANGLPVDTPAVRR